MAAQGLSLDRSTLAGWIGQAAALLEPLVDRIYELGLSRAKLQTDETPMPTLDPGRRAPPRAGCGSMPSMIAGMAATSRR